MGSDLSYLTPPPWSALITTALCRTTHGLFYLGQIALTDGGTENITDRLRSMACMADEFADDKRAEAQKQEATMASKAAALTLVADPESGPEAPDGTVRNGMQYVHVPLASGETAYHWFPVTAESNAPRIPTRADRIAELRAEIERRQEVFDQSESRGDFEAIEHAKRDLEYELVRADREAQRAAARKQVVESADYKERLAEIDAKERKLVRQHEALVSEQRELLAQAAKNANRAWEIASAAQQAAEERRMLRQSSGERVGWRANPVVAMGVFAREVRNSLPDYCRAHGIPTHQLDNLLG